MKSFKDYTTPSDGSDNMVVCFRSEKIEFIKQNEKGLRVVLMDSREYQFGKECSITFYKESVFIG